MRERFLLSMFTFVCCLLMVFVIGCGDDDDDNNDSDSLIINEGEVSIPGTLAFSAKVDGKAWKAALVTAQYGNAGLLGNTLVVAGFDSKDGIEGQVVSFSIVSATEGPGKISISQGQAGVVFFRPNEERISYSGTEGEVEITQINEKGAKGTFHFTATKVTDKGIVPGDTIEVASGVFNIIYGENIPLP